MEDIKTILDRVLAGVGEMVAERKSSFIHEAAVGVPGEVRDQREGRTVAIEGTRESTSAGTRLLPVVSQTGGGKSPKPGIAAESCLHRPMKGGHAITSAAMQARMGRPITDTDSQK
jgi:hypothetical protein